MPRHVAWRRKVVLSGVSGTIPMTSSDDWRNSGREHAVCRHTNSALDPFMTRRAESIRETLN